MKVLAELFGDLKHYRYGDDFGLPTLSVTFSVDAKMWKALKAKDRLGSLYGVDLGNFLSRSGILTEYCPPIISDKSNAKAGRKHIRAEYRLCGGQHE